MATKLHKRELKIIAYFLGLTSKDIITCKLLCKSWNIYITEINNDEDDEKEEEKSYYTNTIQIQRSQPLMVSQSHRQRINKPNNMIMYDDYKSSTTTSPSINPIHSKSKRRIKPSDFLKHSLDRAFWRLDQNTLDKMIASGNSPHIKKLKITQINDELLTEKEKKYILKEKRKKYNSNNSNKIVYKSSSYAYNIRSSPPIKHKISDYIPSNTQLLHTPSIPQNESKNNIEESELSLKSNNSIWKPQYPLHLLKNDKSYKRHINKNNSTLKNSKIIKPMPFSRSLTVNKLKNNQKHCELLAQSKSRNKRLQKRNGNEQQLLSTMFDPETFESAILSPPKQSKSKSKSKQSNLKWLNASQPISHSMSKNYLKKRNSPYDSPASSLSLTNSETDDRMNEFYNDDFDDHYDNDYRENNAQLKQIINAGPVKDISFLPPSKPSKIFGVTSDPRNSNIWNSDVGTTTDDDINDDIEFKENDQQYIELQNEENKQGENETVEVIGSNLSKSLLLNNNNKRVRLGTDDSLFFHGNRKRGYTTDSAEIDAIYSRQNITPYELRKQHSQLRIIDNINNQKILKPSPNLLIGNDNKNNKNKLLNNNKTPISISNNSRFRGMSSVSVNSNVMSKLMGPLYTAEEKSNWNDMKKVDHKYQNILKKRRKKIILNKGKQNIGLSSNISLHIANMSGSDDTCTVSTRTNQNRRNKSSFWSNLYDWILGDKLSKNTIEIETSTQHIMESNISNSRTTNTTVTTTTTTSNDDIITHQSGNVLTSPLLMDTGHGLQIKQNLEDIEKKRETETTRISFWRDIVIPNWDLLYKTSVVKLFWEREGIPKTCRGEVWHYAIGNKLNIPLNSFNNVYKVTEQQMHEFIEFMEKQQNINNNMINNNEINAIKSILGGNNISTRSILNVTPKKNKKILNEAGQTVNFCEGLKRKNSIERDICRLFGSQSFDDLILNSIDKKHEHIACVLMAFCNCRKSIGYIQFMTHLVQILLNYQSPKIAFISLCNMLNAEIFEIYIHCNVSEIRQRIEIFTKMLVYNSSDIARHLQKLSILADTYVMDWCNGLFSAQLPLNIVSRIWDLYFLNGEIIIWKCSVALLIILNENLNITKKSHHKIVKILQSIKKSLINHNIIINEEEFVKKIYSIKLPRDVRKWFKRKELSNKKKRKKKRSRRKKRKHRYQKHQKHQKLQKYQKGKLNKQNINHSHDKS